MAVTFAVLCSTRVRSTASLFAQGELWNLGRADHTLRLWDLTEQQTNRPNQPYYNPYEFQGDNASQVKETRRYEGHSAAVYCAVFSADGRYALSGGRDATVRLWDTGELEAEWHRLEGHTEAIQSVAFSPNGKRVLTAAHDRMIRVWDVQNGRQIHRFLGHTNVLVKAVVFLPDSKRALSGGFDNVLRLWTVDTGREIKRFTGHTAGIMCVAVSPDGKRALSGSLDKTARLWDIETGKEIRRFDKHRGRRIPRRLLAGRQTRLDRLRGSPARKWLGSNCR